MGYITGVGSLQNYERDLLDTTIMCKLNIKYKYYFNHPHTPTDLATIGAVNDTMCTITSPRKGAAALKCIGNG